MAESFINMHVCTCVDYRYVREVTVILSCRCFGGAFLMWHPMKYAAMLAEKTDRHGTSAWFVNTGWTGGSYGAGKRMSLKHTRTIIDAIHSGELADAEYVTTPMFAFAVPKHVSGVPDAILQPRSTWEDSAAYDTQLLQLGELFKNNMRLYKASTYVNQELINEIHQGGPKLPEVHTSDDETTRGPNLPRISSCGIANGSLIDAISVGGKLLA